MGWSQGALQDGGSHSRWAMGKAKRSPFCGSYSVSWFVKPDNAASNVWGVRTGNDEKSLKASPLLGEGWRGTETCPDQRPLGSGGQCQVRLSDPRSRTLQTRQTRPLSPLCRLLCPPASWAFHPPFSSWAGLDRLGASRSSGQSGRGPVQAMTRHSLLPSLPTSLDLHGLPLPFRLSRPLGEAEPFPPAPDSGSLTSFLRLPLGLDPEPSALHTESSQNTPLPATDAETEAQGGLLTVSGFQSPVALPLSGPAFLSPRGLVLLDSLTKTSPGRRETWICRSGDTRKMKGEDFLWPGVRFARPDTGSGSSGRMSLMDPCVWEVPQGPLGREQGWAGPGS